MLDFIVDDYLSPKAIAFFAVCLLVLYSIHSRINEELKIRSLGGHAPKITSYIPFGLGIIYQGVKGTIQHKNLESWQGYFSKHGRGNFTVETRIVSERVIFTADQENIKAILATQFRDYGKGEPFHKDWHDFLGDSIFTTDLDQWHDSRQLIRPQFIKDRVSDLEVFEEHVQTLMTALANGGVKGAAGVANDNVGCGRRVQVDDLLFRYTLDAATHFLLGSSVDSLSTPVQSFAQAFGEVQRVQNIIARAGPMGKFVPKKSFYAGLKVINEFVEPYIEQVLAMSPEELATKTKSEHGYTFLHALAGFTRDRKVLRDQLVAVLLAGRDTTASTLSWTFYELSKQPEVFRKLRAEIIEVVGLDRVPTYNDLKSMKYLQNVMNETLRIYPVVPFNVRMALHDTTLPRGGGPDGLSPIGILKDTAIGYSTLCMQRRPDIYPANSEPLFFNPDRWTEWQPKPWTYIPFNGGPRICIGQQFALTEMGYTLVRILQRFESLDGHFDGAGINREKPTLKAEIVLQPGDGVFCAFWDKDFKEKEKLVDV